MVVPSILAGFTDLGISSALTRFSAKYRAEGEGSLVAGILKSGFLFKIILGIAISIICFTFSDLFANYILNRPGMGYLIRLGSILILFQTIFTALNSSFISLDKWRPAF